MSRYLHLALPLATPAFAAPALPRLPASAWQNDSVPRPVSMLQRPRIRAALIAILILVLAISTWAVPAADIEAHNVLHHMNILPFLIAGLLFGWRGALTAVLFAATVQTPSIVRHWVTWPLDAQDQIVELSVFGIAGIVAGVVADREREQRRRLVTTTLELEEVYSELRDKIDQMKKAERLSAAGQLAASLAHEIRNPLASISGAAGILMRGQASTENRDECLNILGKESQRLNKLLTNFLDFARPRLPRFQKVDPTAVIESTVTLARHATVLNHVQLVTDFGTNLPELDCDAEQLKQVLLNLILNAVQASDGAGEVRIRCLATPTALAIEVIDHGHGISPEDQDRIFDPFFTTRESGTGLGLAVAANIIAQHAGDLTCRSIPHQGTTFRIDLPLHRPEPHTLRSPAAQRPSQ